MRSAILVNDGSILIKEIDVPIVLDDEVLIKIMACGVCGTDVKIYQGGEGAAKTKYPMVLGHEFSGEVVEIGSKVTDIVIGDRVAVDPNEICDQCEYCKAGKGYFCESIVGYGTTKSGGFSEYCVVKEKQAYKFTNELTYEQAAMCEPLACCIHGIDLCNIKLGDDILILGAGMIGLLMLQLARMSGAKNIVVIDPVYSKRVLAQELGANITVDPYIEDVKSIMKQNNIKPQVIIECVGSPRTIEQTIDLAEKGSTVMLYGLTSPEATIMISPFKLFQKEITIKSSYINPYTQGRALGLIESGLIDVSKMVVDTVGLHQLEGILSDERLRTKGKFIIDPWK